MKIRLYMIIPNTYVLGPGRRFGIWVQGCNKHCKGCLAPDSWDKNGGYETSITDLAEEILSVDDIEGITISGGEPFLQQDALCELIKKVRERKDIGVILYTGMNFAEIKDTALARYADLIVDGEYILELNDNKSLRGSSNQNIIFITERYKDVISKYYGVQGRKIELNIFDGMTRMIGIPSNEFCQMIGEYDNEVSCLWRNTKR